jgi:hypothetical protein
MISKSQLIELYKYGEWANLKLLVGCYKSAKQ